MLILKASALQMRMDREPERAYSKWCFVCHTQKNGSLHLSEPFF